jgi:hypothetical protein
MINSMLAITPEDILVGRKMWRGKKIMLIILTLCRFGLLCMFSSQCLPKSQKIEIEKNIQNKNKKNIFHSCTMYLYLKISVITKQSKS